MKEPMRMTNIVRVEVCKGKLMFCPFDPLRWDLDPPITTTDMSEIPEWIQRRLAVLMMVAPTEFVEGIGRRISENIFWIYFEENHDTGRES